MEAVSQKNHLSAVLFDMDGVVTDTASAHAAAWKKLFDDFLREHTDCQGTPFTPFDANKDYRQHVDGKPRYDGVADFLHARGIDLPRGSPDDPPSRPTISGLGNRKNQYFQHWLEHHQVHTYPTTLALIKRLRDAGIAVAVFSSSRNCTTVLRNAGVEEMFDTRVDGEDLERLELPGKPDPAILTEAASRLNASPHHTAVVEDSVAGVTAGVRGGFSPVVGIARDHEQDQLIQAGADLVVADAGELDMNPESGVSVRRVHTIPSLWSCWSELKERLESAPPALFLDYDGTLTPIVADPDAARLTEDMRSVLARLAEHWPLAIISGRALSDLRARVALDNVVHAGSHGFEIEGPDFTHTAAHARSFQPALDDAENLLRNRLAGIKGAIIERKPFAIAVHYRQVADECLDRVAAATDEALEQQPKLRKGYGKKVFQLLPRLAWNKGYAIDYLLNLLETDNTPLYIGDDITDEDAFRELAGRGVSVVVRDEDRPTTADYSLDGPNDVQRFLQTLYTHQVAPYE